MTQHPTSRRESSTAFQEAWNRELDEALRRTMRLVAYAVLAPGVVGLGAMAAVVLPGEPGGAELAGGLLAWLTVQAAGAYLGARAVMRQGDR
ncbi:hypothetical protein ACIG3E_32645 [Streptomyces sp. NPDC053474]|uniref:hypothetical protein n=1 Tax=Streptomyces sp. NPDC053474 TaxID=3365704 RepID=UPI0037D1CCFC